MKPKCLKVKNVGIVADTTIPFDWPLICLFGDVQQGKSTLLNCVRWVCGGAFPQDIIRHGEEEASIELEFDGGLISRSWYRSKADGTIKAREITFIRGGKPVRRPATEIARLLNPFLLDQDHLIRMDEKARKVFFAELFPVDTAALDTEFYNAGREAEQLRIKIDAYGDIDLTPVPEDNKEQLRQQLAEARENHLKQPREWAKEINDLRKAHARELLAVDQFNRDAKVANEKRERVEKRIAANEEEIHNLKQKLKQMEEAVRSDRLELTSMPFAEYKRPPVMPERIAQLEELESNHPQTTDQIAQLESALMEAAANDARREQFAKNQERAKQKEADQERLKHLENRRREIKKEKLAKLSELAGKCTIPGVSFTEEGEFTFEGTHSGMLSTSQLMRLSSLLSSLYQESLGIELIDRGESLGKSIFEFIDRAKQEEKTILASIVGEAPAEVPEAVGVFVVEKGKATKKTSKQKDLL